MKETEVAINLDNLGKAKASGINTEIDEIFNTAGTASPYPAYPHF